MYPLSRATAGSWKHKQSYMLHPVRVSSIGLVSGDAWKTGLSREAPMKPAVPLVATGHERGSLLERT
jgi:hypothetical protein